MPFACRLYRSVDWAGQCDLKLVEFPGAADCTEVIQLQTRVMTVSSGLLNFLLGAWLTFLMTGSAYAFAERHTLTQRLIALQSDEDSKKLGVPYLIMDEPLNVVVWSNLGKFIVTFKEVEFRKMEAFIAFILIAIVAFGAGLVYVSNFPFEREMNTAVLLAISFYTVFVCAAFLFLYNFLTAARINGLLSGGVEFLSQEKWRMASLQHYKPDPKQAEALQCLTALQTYADEVDSSFKVLYQTITVPFLATLVAPIAYSIIQAIVAILKY